MGRGVCARRAQRQTEMAARPASARRQGVHACCDVVNRGVANTFLGVITDKTEFGLVAAGYQFENLVLFANMGFATVWLAGTFSRDQFEKAMDIKEDELFPAISPIGYAAGKRRITESLVRKTMKSDKRKPWEELFFMDSFGKSTFKKEAGEYAMH